jgi:hypothetical protein
VVDLHALQHRRIRVLQSAHDLLAVSPATVKLLTRWRWEKSALAPPAKLPVPLGQIGVFIPPVTSIQTV